MVGGEGIKPSEVSLPFIYLCKLSTTEMLSIIGPVKLNLGNGI